MAGEKGHRLKQTHVTTATFWSAALLRRFCIGQQATTLQLLRHCRLFEFPKRRITAALQNASDLARARYRFAL
jgi:hypothetical protein